MWLEKLTPAFQLFLAFNAIVAIAYALYLDSFEKRAEKLAIAQPQDLPRWTGRLQLPSLATFFFQTLLYLQGKEVRQDYPVIAVAVFILGLVITGALQWRVEKNLRLLMGMQASEVSFQRRAMGWVLLASALYFATIAVATGASYLIGRALQLPPGVLGLLVFTGTFAGIALGMLAVFATAPLVVRKLYGAQPIRDTAVLKILARTFASIPEKKRPIAFWIEDDQSRSHLALFAGITNFSFAIRPAVFLSRKLVTELTEPQWHAVVAHEAAHQMSNHLMRRLGLGSLALMGTVLLTSSSLLLAHLYLPTSIAEMLTFVLPWGLLLIPVRAVSRQMREQELEADRLAVTELGADPTALCEALRKSARLMKVAPEQASLTHPSVIQRIAVIEAYSDRSLRNEKDLAA